jgi:hypothetical protein
VLDPFHPYGITKHLQEKPVRVFTCFFHGHMGGGYAFPKPRTLNLCGWVGGCGWGGGCARVSSAFTSPHRRAGVRALASGGTVTQPRLPMTHWSSQLWGFRVQIVPWQQCCARLFAA